MDALASLLWSLALLALAGAGLAAVIGFREGANTLGRACVITILLALALGLPWRAILADVFNHIFSAINDSFDGYGWLVVVGHVALVGWLLARRFFPRFTDERARGRARRRFDRDGGGGR